MSIQIERHAICDGCDKVIQDFEETLFKVTLQDPSVPFNTLNLTFHSYSHVKLWADKKQKELDEKYALADAHSKLHAALDKRGIDKNAYQTGLTPKGEAGESLETLSLKDAQAETKKVEQGKYDDAFPPEGVTRG